MIATSSLLMYLAIYPNTYSWNHIFFSEMLFYMNLLTTAITAVMMLWFMRHIYTDKIANQYISNVSIALFVLPFS